MDISKQLKAVILNVRAKDHEEVLREMSARLLPETLRKATAKAYCDLRDHESVDGVLSGTGSAVFHCLSETEEITDTIVAVAISKKGIPIKGKKESARIFFLLISPIKESGRHLQILSNIEGLLLNRAFHNAVLSASTEEDVRKAARLASHAVKTVFMPLSKEEVFKELGTGDEGITEAEAEKRLKLVGPNALKRVVKSTLLKDFFSNMFFNLFAVLLWAGGAMSFASGMPELGWAIFLVIIINAVFSFWQEYKAERAVEALERLLPKKVRVIREGGTKEIDAEMLVPGDLIDLEEGEGIPSDGRLIKAEDMRVDNSALTGESKPVYKVSEPLMDGHGFIWTEVPNIVFAGTTVLSGSGRMVVTATGMDTEIGRVAYLTQAIKPEMSPLQKEMVNITKTVTFIAVTLGVAFFFLGFSIAGLSYAESFIFAIGIIVANVPEGLLPTVSLSLAMGVQRMARRNAIVKKLSAVETLGSATVICTDKTGTLTTNQMCVKHLYANNIQVDVTGSGYDPSGEFVSGGKTLKGDDIKRLGVDKLLSAAALCNNAALRPPKEGALNWAISGDPTEGALLVAAKKAGFDPDALKEKHGRVAHLAFERMRKRMTTIHEWSAQYAGHGKTHPDEKVCIALVKGAPKEMLELCTGVYLNGSVLKISAEDRERILRENDRMASLGLRILAVAERPVERKKAYKIEEVEKDLTFLGLIAMHDPPRPEVKGAVAACKNAGIRIIVATGDYGLTAKAVADEIGLARDAKVISGDELSDLSHRDLREVLKKGTVIFSRVAPKDKLRVVTALQDIGEVVAATGDGVNDAPALKKADIGIAMGLRGSDVAKESAEMVLADDNFATIVDAIREGRAVYANIKKFVTYIFASNIPEIIPFIAFVIFRIPLPLTVMQILAVDLGTDVFPALGLGVEPPEKGIMDRPPRPLKEKLLDFKTLARAYLFLGPIEAALCLGAFFFAYWIRGWTPGMPFEKAGAVYAAATTMSFAGIVASQVGNVFACRTERESVFMAGFFENRFVLASILIEIALMLTLIYTPVFREVFGFAPLGLKDWSLLLTFPAVLLSAAELRKFILRRGLKTA